MDFRVVVLMLAASPVWAADEALTTACGWLERMNQAISSLEYEGHFVYQHGSTMEAMRIRHEITDQGPREHLLSLNGKAKEVIRDDDSILVLENSGDHVDVRRKAAFARVTPVPAAALETLDKNYSFLVGDQTRVAGQQGQVIALKPRDKYRYGYRLTLEQNTALPLDLAVLDSDGELVSRIMYTNLDVVGQTEQRRSASELRPLLASVTTGDFDKQEKERPSQVEDAAKSRWRFDILPSGYTLKSYRQKQMAAGRMLEHFVFSDGLATLSVYVEDSKGDKGLSGTTSVGPVNAMGKVVGEYQFTVVGEVPPAALEVVLSGVRPSS